MIDAKADQTNEINTYMIGAIYGADPLVKAQFCASGSTQELC